MDITKYHKELFNHFGYNFGFVSDLLEKYLEDQNSVSDYWKNYFDQLTGSSKSNNRSEPENSSTTR
ncbi:MAG: hypothetical protein KGZ42_06805, partial [Melioribacter sp.]|nr:hypothetical protein [Melioribacter sp.]